MKEEVKRWWEQAEDDLGKALDNFEIKHYDLASFLCQQALEKGLKALLIANHHPFIKTHDCVLLGKKVNLPQPLITICKQLGPVYIETRYPDAKGDKRDYTKSETQKDITGTEEVIQWIKKQLL